MLGRPLEAGPGLTSAWTRTVAAALLGLRRTGRSSARLVRLRILVLQVNLNRLPHGGPAAGGGRRRLELSHKTLNLKCELYAIPDIRVVVTVSPPAPGSIGFGRDSAMLSQVQIQDSKLSEHENRLLPALFQLECVCRQIMTHLAVGCSLTRGPALCQSTKQMAIPSASSCSRLPTPSFSFYRFAEQPNKASRPKL